MGSVCEVGHGPNTKLLGVARQCERLIAETSDIPRCETTCSGVGSSSAAAEVWLVTGFARCWVWSLAEVLLTLPMEARHSPAPHQRKCGAEGEYSF